MCKGTIGLMANCSIGFMATSLSLLLVLDRRRGMSRDFGVQLGCRAHHVADSCRRAQHEKHHDEERPRVNSKVAEEPVQSPPERAAHQQRCPQLRRETRCDAHLCGWRARDPSGIALLDVVKPLAQLAQFLGFLSSHAPRYPRLRKSRAKPAFAALSKARGT